MKYFMGLTKIIVCTVLFFFIFSRRAYAYLYPGATAYLLQMVIAVLVGCTVAIKPFWSVIAKFVKKIIFWKKKK